MFIADRTLQWFGCRSEIAHSPDSPLLGRVCVNLTYIHSQPRRLLARTLFYSSMNGPPRSASDDDRTPLENFLTVRIATFQTST